MARNDIYLNINALSPADAVVTGQQDMTAATIPELVLGDTPTFNFYFTDNTNVWPSWAGNASYSLTWALSDAVSGDFTPAATTGNATPITGGWSVVLPLNSYDLVGLLNTKRVGQPYPVQNLWQQLRVTDPSGNEVTRAMFWTPVRYRAISDTQNTESASPTGGRFVTVNNVNTLTTPTAAQFYAANPVPTSALGTAANGELLIGNGTGFTKATLTAGTGVSITNASGSITIDATNAQEILTATVKNAESVPITKGQVVYLFGATGNMASVKLAYNTSDATSAKTFGVVSDASISAGGTGTVTCVGVLDGLNLGSFQDGDTLYLGATAGSVTATKPYAPNHLVYVGIVERANNGNGELYVKIQNGYELDEIHDVQINAPRQSGQTLIYDNTLSLWKNARITAGSNIAVTNGDSSISIGFSGTLPVANGGTGVTTSTGTGSVVLSNTPTLTTPILGTPQSATLTNATGLPISTGVSGLGTGVATFLATPSSANLASAVTDETGTGALVFANTPTLVTPNIGAATGTSLALTGNVTASDLILGTSGPSAKSSINARAARQGLVFNETAGATATLGSAIGESAGTINIVFTVPSAIPSAAMEVFDLYGTGGGDLNDLYITILGTSGDLRLNARYSGTNHLVTLYSGFVTAYAGKTVELAVVLDGTNQTTYLNGVQISQTAIDHNLTGAVNAFLGKSPAGTDIFKGTISSPLIYNRALSAAEVVSLFEAGVPAAADYGASGTPASNTSLVTGDNSTFASNTGFWTLGNGATISGGKCNLTGGGNANLAKAGLCSSGKKFRVTFTISVADNSLYITDYGVNVLYSSITGTGTKTLEFTGGPQGGFQIVSPNGTAVIDDLTLYPIGLLLAPDAGQAGGGLTWYDTSGNAANITLPASGVAWAVPSSQKTASGWTFGGNLTVSGGQIQMGGTNPYIQGTTGTGYIQFQNVGDVVLASNSGKLIFGSNGITNAMLASSGNLLIGTTTDGGQKLQVNGTAAISGKLTVSSANIRLSNSYYLSGNLASGTEITLIGRNSSDKVAIDSDGYGTVFGGSITTEAPTGGAGAWKLGVANTVSPTAPNRTITINVGGTTYYLAAKTTND